MIFDRIRIMLGDSKCPLYHRCPGADNENDSCVTYKGRTEIGGGRTQCYILFKPQIRAQKKDSKLATRVMEGLMHIGGLEE